MDSYNVVNSISKDTILIVAPTSGSHLPSALYTDRSDSRIITTRRVTQKVIFHFNDWNQQERIQNTVTFTGKWTHTILFSNIQKVDRNRT
jgi:hypothetical protein